MSLCVDGSPSWRDAQLWSELPRIFEGCRFWLKIPRMQSVSCAKVQYKYDFFCIILFIIANTIVPWGSGLLGGWGLLIKHQYFVKSFVLSYSVKLYYCSINSNLDCNSLGLTWMLGGQRIKLDCKRCKRSEEKSTEGSSSFTEYAWKFRMLSKSKVTQ